MQKCMIAAALIVASATPVIAAEYYVALDTETNKCRVIAEEPDGKTMTMVGGGAYESEAEAKEAMHSLTACGG